MNTKYKQILTRILSSNDNGEYINIVANQIMQRDKESIYIGIRACDMKTI